MIHLLVMAFIGVILFEVPGLVKKKHWRELIVFLSFMLVAFIITIVPVLGIKVPSLAKGVEFLIKDVLNLHYE